jgi:peroxiredoxin
MAQDAAKRGMTVTPEQALAELPQWAAGFDVSQLQAQAATVGVTAAEFANWARGQVLMARYLRDPGAQELGKAHVAETSGLPRPAAAADIAAALEKTADIRFRFSGFGDSDASEIPMAREGEPAPDFTLLNPNGETVSLSDFRGQPVLVNFWATWCGPCKVEMPLFNHVYEKNSANGLVVLGVNVQEPATLVAPFQQQFGLKFPVVLDENGQVATLYRVRALPTSILVGPDGTLTDAHRGAIVQRSTLLDLVRQIMPNVGT